MCEYFSENAMPWLIGMSYKAIRTKRHKYIHWTQKSLDGVECDELYDLKSDPYEMKNLRRQASAAGRWSRACASSSRTLVAEVGRALGDDAMVPHEETLLRRIGRSPPSRRAWRRPGRPSRSA